RDWTAVSNDAIKGHNQLLRSSVQAASFLFEQVLKRDPDNYIALLDEALLSGARQKRDDARRLLERARDLYPTAAEVYYQLGHFEVATDPVKGVERARTLWQVAARLDPLNEEALYDAACAFARQGRPSQSLDLLEQAIGAGFHNYEAMSVDPDLDPIR